MKRRQSNASNTGGKGGKRMKEFGYKAVMVWLDASELAIIEQAREISGRKRASFMRWASVTTARTLIAEAATPQPKSKRAKGTGGAARSSSSSSPA